MKPTFLNKKLLQSLKTYQDLLVLGLMIALLSFIYLSHMPTHLFFGDSGEFSGIIALGGNAHAPGYPLYTFLAHFFANLIPGNLPIVFKGHLFSVFISLLSATGIYVIAKKILHIQTFIALFGTLSIMMIYPVWLYSMVAEVFALNMLFAVLIILIAWYTKETDKSLFRWTLLAAVMGLALSHHQTIVFIFPAISYYLWQSYFKQTRLTQIIVVITFFVFLALPYIGLYFTSQQLHFYYFGQPNTIKNIVNLFLRTNYGTFKAYSFVPDFGKTNINQLIQLSRFLLKDFTFIGILLALIGITQWRQYKIIRTILIAFIFSGPLFIFYAGFEQSSDYFYAIIERFYILPFFLLGILIMVGAQQSINLIKNLNFYSYLQQKRLYLLSRFLIVFPYLLILSLGFIMWQKNNNRLNLRHLWAGQALGQDILTSVPNDGILIVDGDTIIVNPMYLIRVEKIRTDIKQVPTIMLNAVGEKWITTYLGDIGYDLNKLPLSIYQENPDDVVTTVYRFASSELDSYTIVPLGILTVYYPQNKSLQVSDVIKQNERLWNLYAYPKLPSNDLLYRSEITDIYALGHLHYAAYLESYNYIDLAVQELDQAEFLISAQFKEQFKIPLLRAKIASKNNQCAMAEILFLQSKELTASPITRSNIYSELITLSQDCLKDQTKVNQYQELKKIEERKQQTPVSGLY